MIPPTTLQRSARGGFLTSSAVPYLPVPYLPASYVWDDEQVADVGYHYVDTDPYDCKCVTWGDNERLETEPLGDDQIAGDTIWAGNDFTCNTPANNRSRYYGTDSVVSSSLSGIYNQCCVQFYMRQAGAIAVNFDLNGNGALDRLVSQEWETIHTEAMADPNLDLISTECVIYVVRDINSEGDYIQGFSPGGRRVYVKGSSSLNTLAHELGHAFAGLADIEQAGIDDPNLMVNVASVPDGTVLRKPQWDMCNGSADSQ